MNMELPSGRENTPPTKTPWLQSMLIEILLVACIVAVGWFLIGYYASYEFLATGYQDWIYHAFRIRDIAQYGIASWDHVWGNGVNHWRAFQYIEHILTFYVTRWTGISITHAMMWVSISVFIGIRISMYLVLRYLGINRLFSFFTTIVSYATSQQWTALKEYSIYIGFIVVPFYTLLWIAALKNMRYIYALAAVTGALWSVHPVIGYSASGMFFVLVLANNLKKDIWAFMLAMTIFLVSSMPFTIQYFFSGYGFSNPFYVTPQFMRMLLAPEYFGLSLLYFIFLSLSWAVLIFKSNESPRWAKILLIYCTFYLVFIYFGLLGYYPSFVNKFQFSRAIPFIALLSAFCFAAFLQTTFPYVRSRMLYTVFLVVIVVSIAQSIEIASQYSGQPVQSIQNPAVIYFSDKDIPQGSIYVKDVAEASHLGKPGLRFITSYNQHLLPNPYPMRFDGLMKTDISYTGVTEHQIEIINDYSLVLGVEYIFIPKLSPLVDGLTVDRESSPAMFEKVDEVTASDAYAVLHNKQPIAYAYAFEKDDEKQLLRFDNLPKPTLQATSYIPWDDEISQMAKLIRDGSLKPLPLAFGWPDKLTVESSELASFRNPDMLVAQSYDQNWAVSNARDVRIEPTNLRFMHLILPDDMRPSEIGLENNWPWWHWPVQGLGIGMVLLTTMGTWLSGRLGRESVVSSR
ncbi:MAG: hypothetical protein PHT88_01850 [Candidatus Moranbacteria bacterium]|nr:hypothetical protein [Candidatus Moranbacteria bacterium]